LLHGRCHVLAAAHTGRIALRTNDDEVVVHHVLAHCAEASRHEPVLERPRVHQHHVRVTVFAELERSPGAHRHHPDLAAVFRFEYRQDGFQQTRVLGAGRGREPDFLCRHRGHCCQGESGEQQNAREAP